MIGGKYFGTVLFHAAQTWPRTLSLLRDWSTLSSVSPRSLPANLEEISEHSLVLLLDEEVPRGANIQIVCNTQILNGHVETITADELLGWYIRVRLATFRRKNEGRGADRALRPERETDKVLLF